MSKLEIVNQIRNKVIGNIKNKLWFKNYQYKSQDVIGEKIMFSLFYSLIYCGIFCVLAAFDMFKIIEQLSPLTEFIILSFSIFGLDALTSFSLFKRDNKTNKKEIDDFIKNSKSGENKSMVDFLDENKITNNLKRFSRFVKNQPLDKEDIERFNQMLNENFSKDELNHIFYNEKLNNIIKTKGSIDYDYVVYALNLLEEKIKDENNKVDLNIIKNSVFKEEDCNKNMTYENNIKEEMGTIQV